LLEASSIDDEDGEDFDDKILRLVLAALAGKDIERATRQAEESIIEAKAKLEAEEANIDAMLGSMDGAEYVGPRAPKLPPVVRSMDPREFTLAALKSLGADITPQKGGLYLVEENGGREWIRFDETKGERRATLYAPDSAAFSRLVGKMIATGVHLQSALALAVEVEALCEQYWRALQIGKPNVLSDDEMTAILEKFKSYNAQAG